MSTITKAKRPPKGAKGRLEDLEVHEVSPVDKPANKRKFLIVKSEDGGRQAIIEESDMAVQTKEQQQEASLEDILGLTVPIAKADDEAPVEEEEEAPQDGEGDEEETETQVTKSLNEVLADLTQAANNVKENGLESAFEDLKAVAKSLHGLSWPKNGVSLGIDGEDAESQIREAVELVVKAAGEAKQQEEDEESQEIADLLATASSAIVKACDLSEDECGRWPVAKGEKLAALLNRQIDRKAKSREDRAELIAKMGKAAGITPSTVTQILRAEISCPPVKRLDAFAKTLGISASSVVSAAQQDGCKVQKSEEAPEAQADTLRVFGEPKADENGDMEVVLKRGAKMASTRLSRLKDANRQLAAIINELEGSDMSDKETKNPVEKSEESIADQIAAGLTRGFEAIEKQVDAKFKGMQEKFDELQGGLDSKIEAVTKRFDEFENANPGSNAGSDQPESVQVEKSEGGAVDWSNIFGAKPE